MSRAMRQISGRVKVKPAILDSDLAPQPQHQHYILFFFSVLIFILAFFPVAVFILIVNAVVRRNVPSHALA